MTNESLKINMIPQFWFKR